MCINFRNSIIQNARRNNLYCSLHPWVISIITIYQNKHTLPIRCLQQQLVFVYFRFSLISSCFLSRVSVSVCFTYNSLVHLAAVIGLCMVNVYTGYGYFIFCVLLDETPDQWPQQIIIVHFFAYFALPCYLSLCLSQRLSPGFC